MREDTASRARCRRPMKTGVVLKQSEKSGIMVRIPLELCSYVIHVSGERYSGKEELTAFFNRILA